MVLCFAVPVLTFLALPGILLGDLVFHCSNCNAELQAACPKLATKCTEIVREPGCGCCPVCARLEGEFCGVYTPRCSTGLRCYPTPEAEMPLEQLVQGFGRCSPKVDTAPQLTDHWDESAESAGAEAPLQARVTKAGSPLTWSKDMAIKQARYELKTRMKTSQHAEGPGPLPPIKSPCEQELDKVLNEISEMTFSDNRGPLENLYELNLPNCDRRGQYNMKQCHMAAHGQRGECWCVNPFTGVQIAQSTKVRGDPKCSQYVEEMGAPPTVPLQMAEM